jgi:hypothetical protein
VGGCRHGRISIQVCADSRFVLVAEALVNILIHEGCLPDTEV